jgi:uncharacterized membrane protein
MAQTKTAMEQTETEKELRRAWEGEPPTPPTPSSSTTSERRPQPKRFERRTDWNQIKQRNAVKGWNEKHLARGLGWFSLGLGLAEVLVPRELGRLIGVRGDQTKLFRMLGAREIASGIGILLQRQPAASMWTRVGGDALDLALLGTAMSDPKADRRRLCAATTAVAAVTALDLFCSQQLSLRSNARTPGSSMRVAQSIAINRPPEELYRFWRDFQNLPRFMKHLESVQVNKSTAGTTSGNVQGQTTSGECSHWVVRGPAGTTVEWDAEIIEDHPNEWIAWRSLEGADVDNTGSVRFERAPGGRGTVVRVRMQYAPPAGVIGATIAKLFGEDPSWQVKDDLRRFKQVMETGEIITTEGQPAGRSSSTSWRYDSAVRS